MGRLQGRSVGGGQTTTGNLNRTVAGTRYPIVPRERKSQRLESPRDGNPVGCDRSNVTNVHQRYAESETMRKRDAWGKPILKVGDIVTSVPLKDDPGTVMKILSSAPYGTHYVAVKWFSWGNGTITEERVSELNLVSKGS